MVSALNRNFRIFSMKFETALCEFSGEIFLKGLQMHTHRARPAPFLECLPTEERGMEEFEPTGVQSETKAGLNSKPRNLLTVGDLRVLYGSSFAAGFQEADLISQVLDSFELNSVEDLIQEFACY